MPTPSAEPAEDAARDVADAAGASAEHAGTVAAAADRTDRDAHETVRRVEEAERAVPTPQTHAAAAQARATEADADTTAGHAGQAHDEALAAAVQADELLLDEQARKVAAQVTPEQPFGVPGRPGSRRSPLRLGFTYTVGALLAIGLGQAFVTVEHELLLILVAIFVAIGLDPAVRFLVDKGMRRSIAVALITVGFLAAVTGFIAAAVPPLAKQGADLVKQAPTYLQELNDRHSFLGRLNLQYHVTDRVKAQASGKGFDAAGGLLHAGGVLVSVTFEVVIVLVLIVYFLADLGKIKAAFYRLFPFHRRPRVGLLGDEVISRVGGYVLGNVLTSIVATVGNYIVLLALGVPYALVLSILVGVLDLVPLVGSTIGGAIVALVALVAVSGTAAVITIVYHVVYRLFEDYFLNPRVLRKTVDVSPVVTVIAVLIGGSLLGIIGALIAVPTAAAFQLFLTEVVYPQRDGQTAAQ